jgi:NAD(P) transhydrogenase subunit alpha
MIVGIARETRPGENRVALVPELIAKLGKAGLQVVVEPGAGTPAGFPDNTYEAAGARLDANVCATADVLLCVQPPLPDEVDRIREGATLIGLLQPASSAPLFRQLASRRITAFAMELMPRITRAQPMDVLSAMSTVAGYKAVLLAADRLPRFFPLLMTAAGTILAARVLIIGAGVAGLQAIGTARRLGAVVYAYDTRPAVKEQVESLGAKFVELGVEAKEAEAATGYAKAQSEEFYQQQRRALGKHVAEADVVVTTALIPGKPAPLLITEEAVRAMRPGSVIVDLAAEQGGNCALTKAGMEVVDHGVLILGPVNLPATLPFHASQMYARTVTSFLLHLCKDGQIKLDLADELTKAPLVTHEGKVLYPPGAV